MTELWGRTLDRRSLSDRVGDLRPLAGVRRATLSEGAERGSEILDVRTGSGFDFTVCPSRGMSLTAASYRGIPLCWHSPTGVVAPEHYDPRGAGWLRGFFGGLLTTCGLTNVGTPSTDGDEELGLHGRAAYLPATAVRAEERWQDDDLHLEIAGRVRETSLFHHDLTLDRTVAVRAGEPRLRLVDTVTNTGGGTAPLMILYHMNFGWPLLDDGAEVVIAARETEPRDEDAAAGVERWNRAEPPRPGQREQVFFHRPAVDDEGWAEVALVNERLAGGLGVAIRYRPRQLPRLVQWKLMASGMYVMALEPANCGVGGRAAERRRGTLEELQPGESRRFELEIGILDGAPEIEAMRERVGAW